MTALAPTLEAYFTERLVHQRQPSPNTVVAYRDAWRLLLGFAQQRTTKQPCQLDISDLDAPLIAAFLTHLEIDRHNCPRTRNARLAAIRSFFAFAALAHPEHAALIARVLAIPTKRCDKALVNYLTGPEADAVTASLTASAGPAGATTRCSSSPSRPGCGSPSSPGYATRTLSYGLALTCAAGAKAESSGAHRYDREPSLCCAPG
jgi:site-specific recombinase XerD